MVSYVFGRVIFGVLVVRQVGKKWKKKREGIVLFEVGIVLFVVGIGIEVLFVVLFLVKVRVMVRVRTMILMIWIICFIV